MTDDLQLQLLPIDDVQPNPWNPNRQTEREFQAVVESVTSNGFVLPIVARAVDGGFQVIDGEHRLRALQHLISSGDDAGAATRLVLRQQVPAILITVTDAQAKKLTIILNETRGSADTAELSALLADIRDDLGDELGVGLPYTETELEHLLSMGEYDWDAITGPVDDSEFDSDDDDTDSGTKITVLLDDSTHDLWVAACEARDVRPTDAAGAGIVLQQLLLLAQ